MKNLAAEAVTTDYKELIKQILHTAKEKGASSAEASIGVSRGFSVDVRLGEVETVEQQQDKGLSVLVYFGHRKGFASTSDLSKTAIEETVAAACNIAKFTQEDDCSGLAEPDLMAYDYPDLDLYHPWDITVDQAIEQAKTCEKLAMSMDKRITNSEGASVATGEALSLYGNSNGFIGEYPSTRHNMSCILLAAEGDHKQRDYGYTVARDAADLYPIERVAKEAAEKTVGRLNARKLSTRKVPVVFAADIAGGLLGSFVQAIQGGNLYRKASFLLDQLDHQIFPSFVQIVEDPFIKKGLGSVPFDNEGVKVQKRNLVVDGVLKGYVLNSYTARKLKMQTTGNAGGVHNLMIKPTAGYLPDVLQKMDRGLLVTELMGQGVNILTGDYSRGAVGYWVENGLIQYPVHEITIANNLKDMFANIVAIGSDIDVRHYIMTGCILVESMTVAGE